jgi:hypothetical protein
MDAVSLRPVSSQPPQPDDHCGEEEDALGAKHPRKGLLAGGEVARPWVHKGRLHLHAHEEARNRRMRGDLSVPRSGVDAEGQADADAP